MSRARILITGASGFLGQALVHAALAEGQRVKAGYRSSQPKEWQTLGEVAPVHCDLRDQSSIDQALSGVDTVIHAAAELSGSLDAQLESSVQGTENLLNAMQKRGVSRLHHISSFSVYNYLQLKPYQVLTEASPLDTPNVDRDAYAQSKLLQEQKVHDFGSRAGNQTTIYRPGFIVGPERLWMAKLGLQLKHDRWLLIGKDQQLPIIYVDDCANAVLSGLHSERSLNQIYNIVGNELPSIQEYVTEMQSYYPKCKQFPLNWRVLQSGVELLHFVNHYLAGDRLSLPSILKRGAFAARCKPLTYSNTKAVTELNWQPQVEWRRAIELSITKELGF